MSSLRLDRKTLCKGLPYHIIVDKDLVIVQLGSFLSKSLKLDLKSRNKFGECFVLFEDNEELTVSEYEVLKSVVDRKVTIEVKRGIEASKKSVTIRGQFTAVRETSSLMFHGSPCVASLGEMKELGLCLSDIPIHDPTRDLVLFDKAAEAQGRMKRRMENLQTQIQAASEEADQERQKNVTLLQLLFPPDIARRLWKGETIEPQRHDEVTLLFSDLVGFTAICSTATPSQVVEMLRTLYNEFDKISGVLDVYKLETIGDAYCCACGLDQYSSSPVRDPPTATKKTVRITDNRVCPVGAETTVKERNDGPGSDASVTEGDLCPGTDATVTEGDLCPGADTSVTARNNAARIAWMGLEMLRCTFCVDDHRGQRIKMRVGIHTGTILTGVVGQKMPKYCLFGSDVTIANQMESSSEQGRLHASPTTYKHLADYGGFFLEERDVSTLPKALQESKTPGGFVNHFFMDKSIEKSNYSGETFDSHDAIMKEVKLINSGN